MNYFCSYCDVGYLGRLICLHDSLRRSGEPFLLTVLCFDQDTERIIRELRMPSLGVIGLAELLAADSDYAGVRAGRSKVEFYFTSTPVLVRHCFKKFREANAVTYLDSDLFFFGPPSQVFSKQNGASIAIVPHRFPLTDLDSLKWGRYNVAWVFFKRDEEGIKCVEWWRARCLEWCHDYLDNGKFADQGYLDDFPRLFSRVGIVDDPGVNAAPWNVQNIKIRTENGAILVAEKPLIFYHFQGIREITPGWFEPGLRAYRATMTQDLRELIYIPYLRELMKVQEWLRATYGITPLLGYQRLPSGNSVSEKWDRFVSRVLLPVYRKLTGRLIHCSLAKR